MNRFENSKVLLGIRDDESVSSSRARTVSSTPKPSPHIHTAWNIIRHRVGFH